jgi:hypothetical protein
MTDLPKLTVHEFQDMLNAIDRAAQNCAPGKPVKPQPECCELCDLEQESCSYPTCPGRETSDTEPDIFPRYNMTGPGSFELPPEHEPGCDGGCARDECVCPQPAPEPKTVVPQPEPLYPHWEATPGGYTRTAEDGSTQTFVYDPDQIRDRSQTAQAQAETVEPQPGFTVPPTFEQRVASGEFRTPQCRGCHRAVQNNVLGWCPDCLAQRCVCGCSFGDHSDSGCKPHQMHVFKPKRSHHKPKPCHCPCAGCTDPLSTSKHCLTPPCSRLRNKRSQVEIDADQRYANGRVRVTGVQPGKPRRARTPEQIEAAGRYANGRPKPVRENWSAPAPKKHPPKAGAQPHDDPLAVVVRWFVHARRGGKTVRIPAPNGEGQAKVMAQHLSSQGWTGPEGYHNPCIESFEP